MLGWSAIPTDRFRAIAVVVAVTVAAFGLGSGALALLSRAIADRGIPSASARPVLVLANFVVLQGLAFGAVTAAYIAVRGAGRGFLRLRRPTARHVVLVFVGSGLLLALAIVVGLLSILLGVDPARNRVAEFGGEAPWLFVVLVPISFLLIGPGEELLFRGVVQRRLRESFSAPPAIVLASALFAGPHVFALTGGSAGVTLAVLFGLGLILGWFYEWSDNLVVPILMHGTYNALLFALLYVRIRAGAGLG